MDLIDPQKIDYDERMFSTTKILKVQKYARIHNECDHSFGNF